MRFLWPTAFSIGFALIPANTSAHIIGQQVRLPLPVDFYVIGAMCAFIASCTVLLLFSEPTQASEQFRKLPRGVVFPRTLQYLFRIFGLLVFVAALLLAYFGTQDFTSNPLPNFFWIIVLLLFTYSTGLIIGNQWKYLDPFRFIADRVSGDVPERELPNWLRYLPTFSLFALLWLELYSSGLGALPIVIGTVLVCVVAMGTIGSSIWGPESWFKNADIFTTLFGIVSRVAPLQILDGRIILVWPGERLIRESAEHAGTLAFTLLLLGSTVLDGLRETKIWYQLMEPVPYAWDKYIGLVLLVAVPVLLFGLYALCIAAMARLTSTDLTQKELRLKFAYSLIPIAVAYHFAHYFSLVLSQGQSFIAQVSDPLGKGWDVFGTAQFQMNLDLVRADTVWYIQLSAIVLGHILAAVVAHYVAQRTFRSKYEVIVSQLPMLVLMVSLTAFGLWTLSQPFVS